jgi:NAD(P)-dependent dehydrogenase (short-subunit alcohol dehydrogenase family)
MKPSGTSACRAWPYLAAGAGAIFILRSIRRRLRRVDFAGKSVVISGGSRGLGLELARQFAGEGAKVAILARSAETLERAKLSLEEAGADIAVYTCDVGNPEQVEKTVAAIVEERGGIDVLVNNAGTIQVAPFENLDLDDFREALDVYAWGPLHLVRATVPQMRKRRFGRIVNISSIGGVVAVPHLLAYTMGKFALTGLSDGLRAELGKDGILVTTVIPGLMRTGSHVRGIFKGQHRKEFAWFAVSGANPLLSTGAARAAQQIVEACRYGKPRLIITYPARLLHFVNALFPGITAFGSRVAARLLPAPVEPAANARHAGWQSSSRFAPSVLTRLNDRSIRQNNEQ